MILAPQTLHRALSTTRWSKVSEVVEYLNQCGPLAFVDDNEYETWRSLWKYHQKYNSVRYSLNKWRGVNIDMVLGDDKGNEVPVYMYVPSVIKGIQ